MPARRDRPSRPPRPARRLRRPRQPVLQLRRLAAGVLALAALVLALRPLPTATATAPPVAGTPVVVATADLTGGTVLGAGDLEVRDVSAELVPDGAPTDPGAFTGAVLAGPVRSGEVLTDARVVGPGLWSLVPPGQVAAPVRLADLAVAALLRTGDRVDVLATGSDAVTEVVVADALVLAVPPAGTADPAGPAGAGLLVLAVAEDAAQRLAAASTGSTLTVTLGPP